MVEFLNVIKQLAGLGVNDPLLDHGNLEEAKKRYRRAYELDLVKKGKVLLQQYDFVRRRSEEMQLEMADLRNQLDEMDQMVHHTLVLDGGEKIDFQEAHGEVFARFLEEVKSVVDGGRYEEDIEESENVEEMKKANGELKRVETIEKDEEVDRKEEKSKSSQSRQDSDGQETQHPKNDDGEAVSVSLSKVGEVKEEETSDLDSLDLGEIDLGDLGEVDMGDDIQALKVEDGVYDVVEVENESDALLDFL